MSFHGTRPDHFLNMDFDGDYKSFQDPHDTAEKNSAARHSQGRTGSDATLAMSGCRVRFLAVS